MKRFWKKKLVTSWIAIFAILLSTLAPSIASAFSVRNGNNSIWTEICSASNVSSTGNKLSKKFLVKLATDAADSSTAPDSHEGKHCPFCLPHAGNFALPPALMPCVAVAAGHDAFPSLYYQAPSLLFSWVTANPRGPPQLS
jgi:hypothetical protein